METTNHAPQWTVRLARATVFLVTPDTSKAPWWMSVVGQEPETTKRLVQTGQIEESGPYIADGLNQDGCKLLLRRDPRRVDWILQPSHEDMTQVGLSNIGGPEAALDALLGLMRKWLEAYPLDVYRLALGFTCHRIAGTRDNAASTLNQYVPWIPTDDGTADQLVQINRPRMSGTIGDLKWNRLSKWSILQLQVLNFAAEGLSGPVGAPTYMNQVELDINTDAMRTIALPQDAVNDMLAESGLLALEILADGDKA